jgi:hypothetical protein
MTIVIITNKPLPTMRQNNAKNRAASWKRYIYLQIGIGLFAAPPTKTPTVAGRGRGGAGGEKKSYLLGFTLDSNSKILAAIC